MDSTKVKRPVLRYHGGKFLLAKWIISHFPPHRIYTEAFGGFGSASTNAKHSTGFRSNSNRSGTTPAQDWNHFPDHIQSFVDRLKGVVIENRDFAEVIQQLDTADTLHYLDPPYPHSTRNMQRGNAAYAHEMNDLDHVQMADVLKTVRGGGGNYLRLQMRFVRRTISQLFTGREKGFCRWRCAPGGMPMDQPCGGE